MGIASNLPFEFELTRNYPEFKNKSKGHFYISEKEAWEHSLDSFQIEENEEIEILFDAEDISARLYLEALDIVPPNEEEMEFDEQGDIYRYPRKDTFFLYKHNKGYDALCVDTFLIVVYCTQQYYYSTLKVNPKPFSENEWIMMKDDLENEITGLAQDLVRRNLGLGTKRHGNIPPKVLHDFIIMQKYSKKILPALIDIADCPRYQISTRYKRVLDTKNCTLDEKSVRRYITRAGSEAFYQVPEKVINYDIQDNRILKMILQNYDKRLNEFIEIIDNNDYEFIEKESKQYRIEWLKSVESFKYAARKLKKITSLIRTTEWYATVGEVLSPYIPHSFFMDSRYNVLYQMHNEMRTNTFKVDFDPQYSYTWKKSSYLYEMWCFIKICRMLENSFPNISGDLLDLYAKKMLFPYLHTGSKIIFSDGETRLEVIFDAPLGYDETTTSLANPVYMAKTPENRHNRPDILINTYDENNGWYIGSIVVECKYRKINSFWENGKWSSIQQFQAYASNLRSKYQYGGKWGRLNSFPAKKVIVLTPDQKGDGKEMQDFNIEVKGFKPSATDDEWIIALKIRLIEIIEDMKKVSLKLKDVDI
ncbi:MAG: restriction endonuclease-like protein [Eubacterium sp.]|nr:restriction endonuclease-like protein [Eubacterium sp.]MCI6996274.1 restriction endonuclease-like protein [Eubacterium sp.]